MFLHLDVYFNFPQSN
ncbi:hypothetical protein VCHENC02_2171A, partial [Vibrio harveyi]